MNPNTVSVAQFAKGLASITPDLPVVAKGLYHLITTKPKQYRSIGMLIEKHARKQPNNIAVRYENITWSYRELNERINQTAHGFQARGVGEGDVVGVLLENRPETLIAVFAAVKLGAIASMFNTSQRGDVLMHSIKTALPKLIVVGEEMLDNMATVESRLPTELSTQLFFCRDQGHSEMPQHYTDIDEFVKDRPTDNPDTTAKVQLSQPCYYIFTSGTTGLPKASVMTHFRWFKSMAGMGLASLRLRKEDTLYLSLPLYHNNALTVSMAAVLGAGATVAIARKFSVSRFWDEVRFHNATVFCYIGELCRYLLNSEPKSNDADNPIRAIIGNGMRPDIWVDFKQRFGIKHVDEFYGASECNLVFTNAFNIDKTCGTCPLKYALVEYDIEQDEPVRDAKGRFKKIKKGDVGLLITAINSKQPFDGYTDSDASNKKIFRDVFKNGDQWFNTGDLVLNQGFNHIAFADRIGDTFRWKGENVATTEVEAALMEYPNIEHAVVYGVEIPHTDGRAGMAAITLNGDANDVDWGAVARHLYNKLPAYAVPLFLRIKPQETVTGTFKYRKVELKNEAYHLDQTTDPILFLDTKEKAFNALGQDTEAAIEAGDLMM